MTPADLQSDLDAQRAAELRALRRENALLVMSLHAGTGAEIRKLWMPGYLRSRHFAALLMPVSQLPSSISNLPS